MGRERARRWGTEEREGGGRGGGGRVDGRVGVRDRCEGVKLTSSASVALLFGREPLPGIEALQIELIEQSQEKRDFLNYFHSSKSIYYFLSLLPLRTVSSSEYRVLKYSILATALYWGLFFFFLAFLILSLFGYIS